MAGDENTWDMLRMTGLAVHINNKDGQLYQVNTVGENLNRFEEEVWGTNYHDFCPDNEDPRTREVPKRVIAAADPKGNGPWIAQKQGTEKEQQASDLLNGYIHLGGRQPRYQGGGLRSGAEADQQGLHQ